MAGGSYDVVVDERPAEAPAAPSPRVVELAGLNGATPLEALALRARRDGRDVGALVAHIFVALRTRRDEARDVCRVCLGAGLVRSADDDDDGSEKLLRDCCGCRGSMCAVHGSCLVAWWKARGAPTDLACPTCKRPYANEAGLLLSRKLVARRRAEDERRVAAEAPETPQALLSRKHAAITEATHLWRNGEFDEASRGFETALAAMAAEHGGRDDALRGDIYAVTATLNLALVDLALNRLEASERRARWAQSALVALGSPHALRSSHNLAMILDERGRAPEACALYEGVLRERRATLGADHVDSLRTACDVRGGNGARRARRHRLRARSCFTRFG